MVMSLKTQPWFYWDSFKLLFNEKSLTHKFVVFTQAILIYQLCNLSDLIFNNFYFDSMSRKQNVIHLGRSKSPSQFRVELVNRIPSSTLRTSRSKDPLQQGHLNNSMHIAPQLNQIKIENGHLPHTHSGFFPPSPRTIDQVIVKENVKCAVKTPVIHSSPLKRVIVSRPVTIPSEMSPNRNQSSIILTRTNEPDVQLQRKLKFLEARVQQLHQQKQACVVKSHEENRKLCSDNAMLQNRLANVENLKNQEIANLRQEIFNLRNIQNSQRIAKVETSSKPVILTEIQKSTKNTEDISPVGNKSLKNMAYIDDEPDDKVSLSNHTYKADNLVSNECVLMENSVIVKHSSKIQDQLRLLRAQNQALKSQLKQLKEELIDSSEAIEENNNKIIETYELKVQQMEQQIRCLQDQNNHLKQALSNAHNQIEEYVRATIEKSQENMKLEDKYKNEVAQLKHSIAFYKEQTEDYVRRTLSKSQELMKLDEIYKGKVFLLQQKCEEFHHREAEGLQTISALKTKLSSSKPIQQNSEIWTQTDEQKIVPVAESCQKCKELIKTLVKLNQKAFSKTS